MLGRDPEEVRQGAIVGTPELLAERLAPYAELGVGDFLLMARPPSDRRTMELIAQKVAPAVRELAGGAIVG